MRYDVVEGWEQLPKGYEHRDVAGVAVDLEDRVFLICRGDHPIIIYDDKGSSWARGARATSRYALTASRSVPTTRCTRPTTGTTRSGSSRRTASCSHARHHEQAIRHRLRRQGHATVSAAGRPLQSPDQHRRSAAGRPLRVRRLRQLPRASVLAERRAKRSWGVPGQGPGEFFLPHGIAVQRTAACSCATARTIASRSSARTASTSRVDRHAASDPPRVRRAGSRVRLGALVAARPGLAPLRPAGDNPPSVRSRERLRQGRPRAGALGRRRSVAIGNFAAPHGLAVDSRRDVYVSEVTWTFAGSRGHVPEGTHAFQKFQLAS